MFQLVKNLWVTRDPHFPDLKTVQKIPALRVGRDPLSEIVKYDSNQTSYYIKRYHLAGKGLRRWLGRSRARAEWENLLFFKALHLKVPRIISYGETRILGLFKGGAYVMQALPPCIDLANAVKQQHPIFSNPKRLDSLTEQLALATQTLHAANFIHNDLKWRNLMLSEDDRDEIYFIDCPVGRVKKGYGYRRGVIKDLACLDKVAKYHLSKSRRLQFFKRYRGIAKLTLADKQMIARIIKFFEGRE